MANWQNVNGKHLTKISDVYFGKMADKNISHLFELIKISAHFLNWYACQ